MCLAVPGKVVRINGEKALIDYGSEQREAKLAADVKEGDYALVQQGFVVARISEKEAREMIEAWREAQS